MSTRPRPQPRRTTTSVRGVRTRRVLAGSALTSMVIALSVPLGGAAYALGETVPTDATTAATGTSTTTATATGTTAETTTAAGTGATTVTETTGNEPTPVPTATPTADLVAGPIDETVEEVERVVVETVAEVTDEPSDEPSPEPSPESSEPAEPAPEPSSEPSGGQASKPAGSDDTVPTTAKKDSAAAAGPSTTTSGKTDTGTADGPASRAVSDAEADRLAAFAASDPQQQFAAAGTGSTSAVNRDGLLRADDDAVITPQARPTATVQLPAYLLSGPYAGGARYSTSGPRSTVDILRRLQAIGAGPAEIVGTLAPFPVMGPASYSDDWNAPRDGGARLHKGTDVFAPRGTPVIAVASGTITDLSDGGGLGGRTVSLTADDGTYYYFAHLDAFNVRLVEGQRVTAGSLLGFVGNTGNAITTPPHLHFEIRPGHGAAVPPVPQLDQWLADARLRLADLEAQKTGAGEVLGVGLIPLIAPPAWADEQTNWAQSQTAGAGLAAEAPGAPGGSQVTTSRASSFAADRPVDRAAMWAFVLAALVAFAIQRRLSRAASRRTPDRTLTELEDYLDEEFYQLLEQAELTGEFASVR